MRHPAKFSDVFFNYFYDILKDTKNVLDPFSGTGKIGKLKSFGYKGIIYANEIEKEWLEPNIYNCDILTYQDAEMLDYPENSFDAICTSPTYGNRMADHFKAKDGSKRITYQHCLGRDLNENNTGKIQWGIKYKEKHIRIYKHLVDLLKEDGLFVLNISNHIRNGEEINVCEFHVRELEKLNMILIDEIEVETPRMGFGANHNKRVGHEMIYVFKRGELLTT